MIFCEPAFTSQTTLADLQRHRLPEIVSVATSDMRKMDAWSALVDKSVVMLTGTGSHTSHSTIANFRPNKLSNVTGAWLSGSLDVLESYRGLSDGWDGHAAFAPLDAAINAAEELCPFIVSYARGSLPTCSVDVLGRPSFAMRTDQLYLHLVVENELSEGGLPLLTWYAVASYQEHFDGEVEFDGTDIPDALKEILSASAA